MPVSSAMQVVRLAWTSDGSGDATVTSDPIGGVIQRVCFIPGGGGSQPTDNYDVVLNDPDGIDVLQGKGANRSNSVKQQVVPYIGDGTLTDRAVAISGVHTLVVSNAGATKTGTVVLYLTQGS